MNGFGVFEKRTPEGFEQITSIGSAKSLTKPPGARMAIITCHTQAIAWRDDGTAPVAGTGIHLPVNTPFLYTGNLGSFKLIEEVAGAVVNVSYYS